MTKYHWGIIGTGDIATQFAAGFQQEKSELSGVSARNYVKVQQFAKKYAIQKTYQKPEDLLADETIDIVYIAVPNDLHHEFIMAALAAGKHVLCEKAISKNLADLEEEMLFAQEKGLILQEAMTIFNMPLFHELKKIAASKKLGKLKMIQAPFGSYKEPDPANRFFNPALGGGALLDIGTYAVSFARFFMSEAPFVAASVMQPFQTGVDEQSITLLTNAANEMASVSLSFQAKMPKTGIVAFEEGYFSIPEYPRADQATLTFRDGTEELIVSGDANQALNYEIATMIATIDGAANHSLALTRDVIAVLDQMQQKWQATV